jgi:site-specific recombinase XerD
MDGTRRVFLTNRAPRHGLAGPSDVSTIVRRAIERSGVSTPTHGAHLLRHSLATELLRRGAPVGEIGELLRHRHPDTTRIYARVDLTALRPLALRWPGGAS